MTILSVCFFLNLFHSAMKRLIYRFALGKQLY